MSAFWRVFLWWCFGIGIIATVFTILKLLESELSREENDL